MKKLNEKELSKVTGGFVGFFNPTVSLYRKNKDLSAFINLLSSWFKR